MSVCALVLRPFLRRRRAIERRGGGEALASKPGCATATAAAKPSSSSLVGPRWQRGDDESHCAAQVHLLRGKKSFSQLYMWEIEWKSEKVEKKRWGNRVSCMSLAAKAKE